VATKAELLTKLGLKEFPDLTAPEFEVLRAASLGEWADLLPWGPPPPTKPKKYNPGGGPLRSELVTWLCTDIRAKRLVHRGGLCIANATLDAVLDLESAEVSFYVGLQNCRLPGLMAPGATLKNNLYLKRCRVDGEVNLLGATISGQFQCQGALFLNRGGDTLNADRVVIGSSVYLSQGFRAVGAVRLTGANITGQLDCEKGFFLNRNGTAINADNAKLGSDMRISQGFRAKGAVRLPGAKIVGQFDCTGGSFWVAKEDEIALNLECSTLLDSIFLDPKKVNGTILLHRAVVNKCLRMVSPTLAKASLDLRGAKIGLLYDASASWPKQGKLHLDGFHYESIYCDAPLTAKERLDWLGHQPQDQFLPQPYEQLAKFYQRAGHDSDARTVRIAKEDKRLEHMHGQPFQSLFWQLAGHTIGYGYKPQMVLVPLSMLILLCAFMFWLGYPEYMTKTISYDYASNSTYQDKGSAIASDYPAFQPIIYSIDVALPIVDLQQERYWMPNSKSEFGHFYWIVNWTEVLLGWFLASMGIAGATGIIRKD
jgi:hypothetical protein